MALAKSPAVDDYLATLAPAQRDVIATVRAFVRKHLPKGYVEAIASRMPHYVIPLSRYPKTYNGQPLSYVALAAQKNKYSLYLLGCNLFPEQAQQLKNAYAQAGKKFDMGKSCLHFKTIDDLVLPAIADIIASTSVDDYIAQYEEVRGLR